MQRKQLWRDERFLFWSAVLALVATAEYLVRGHYVSPASFAAPSEIASGIVHLIRDQGFAHDIAVTTRRALISVALGFPAGLLIALGIHSLGNARSSAELTLDVIRSIPITALIPLYIAIYGIGEANKIAIGASYALLVSATTIWVGIKQGIARHQVLFHLYQPSYLKRVVLIILPQSLPVIVAALRLAVSSALVLVVVAEMFIGTQRGIGKVINDMTYRDSRAEQFAAVVCAGAIGYLLNVAAEALRRWIYRHYGQNDGASATI